MSRIHFVSKGKTENTSWYGSNLQRARFSHGNKSSGYIGFTTGTNDAYMVVTQYLKRHPKSKLKKYLPELRRLSKLPFGDAGRDNTSGLKGYSKAWQKAACKDAEFIQTQLDVGHAMYLKPALKYAASVGIKSNLGKALFYGK